jgi:hypothetical protein
MELLDYFGADPALVLRIEPIFVVSNIRLRSGRMALAPLFPICYHAHRFVGGLDTAGAKHRESGLALPAGPHQSATGVRKAEPG